MKQRTAAKTKRAVPEQPVLERPIPGQPVPEQAPTRAQQKLDTQRRIADAARELFERDGYAATTTDAIARAAGVAKGTIFVHAKDKLDLLMLVMHDALQATVRDRSTSLPRKADLVTQALHIFRGLFEMYAAREVTSAAFLTQYFGADGPNSTRLHALTFTFLHQISELVRSAQARAELAADVDPLLLSSNFFAIYWLALMGWAGKHLTLEQALATLERSLRLQVRGLAPA